MKKILIILIIMCFTISLDIEQNYQITDEYLQRLLGECRQKKELKETPNTDYITLNYHPRLRKIPIKRLKSLFKYSIEKSFSIFLKNMIFTLNKKLFKGFFKYILEIFFKAVIEMWSKFLSVLISHFIVKVLLFGIQKKFNKVLTDFFMENFYKALIEFLLSQYFQPFGIYLGKKIVVCWNEVKLIKRLNQARALKSLNIFKEIKLNYSEPFCFQAISQIKKLDKTFKKLSEDFQSFDWNFQKQEKKMIANNSFKEQAKSEVTKTIFSQQSSHQGFIVERKKKWEITVFRDIRTIRILNNSANYVSLQDTEEELRILFLIFRDLELRNILVILFRLLFNKKGLWSERLYKLFDYQNTQNLNFTEFLQGIAIFTKYDKENQIKTLFRLYDGKEGQNFIEKDEFLKMLFNYPKKDLEELFEQMNMTYDASQSRLDIYQGGSVQYIHSHVYMSSENSQQNKQSMNSNVLTRKVSADIQEIRGLGLKQRKIPMPTSVNNRLKLMTNFIFQIYGENDKLTFPQFKKWILVHTKILESIQGWFRPQIWKMRADPLTNQQLPGFLFLQPNLEYHIKFQKYHSMNKTDGIARIHDVFLFLFKGKLSSLPYKIYLLKGLEISFKDEKKKIYFNKDFKTYQGIKLQFDQEDKYIQWKKYCSQFSNDQQINKYHILQKIGKGCFSIVSQVQDVQTGKYYALKQIEKESLTKEEKIVLENETKIMQILNHPNIVAFIESWESFNAYNYILEYIKGVDMYEYITTNGALSEVEAIRITKILLNTLQTVHNAGVVHRDLKPENIMFILQGEEIKTLKLIDFGFAIFEEKVSEDTVKAGTVNFMAPEILKGLKYGRQSDLFSLGVIIYFLLSAELPFYSEENELIVKKIVEGDYDIETKVFENVTELGKSFVKEILEVDQNKRLTIEYAKKHKWLQGGSIHIQKQSFKKNPQLKEQDSFDLQRFIQVSLIIIDKNFQRKNL